MIHRKKIVAYLNRSWYAKNMIWIQEKTKIKNVKPHNLKNQGFTLTAALISVLIMGISFSAMISMITIQHKQTRILNQQLASASVKYSLLQTLRNPTNCQCHFDPTKNTNIPEENLKIDTTKNPIPEINLKTFRSGCDFNSNENIIVNENTEIKGGYGLKVSAVKVTDIKRTGTSEDYKGDLTIVYARDSRSVPLQSTAVPVLLTVDSSSGVPEGRGIQTCGSGSQTHSGRFIQHEQLCSCTKVQGTQTVSNCTSCELASTGDPLSKRFAIMPGPTCGNETYNHQKFEAGVYLKASLEVKCPPGTSGSAKCEKFSGASWTRIWTEKRTHKRGTTVSRNF